MPDGELLLFADGELALGLAEESVLLQAVPNRAGSANATTSSIIFRGFIFQSPVFVLNA
jgi:hypothetical protein